MSRIPFPIGACIKCGLKNKKLITKRCFEPPNFCYQKYKEEKHLAKQSERQIKKQKPVKIAPISRNRQEALKKYRRLRDKYFEENPVCEFPGCNSREITLHHMRGRIGAFLTDKRYFKSLCWNHHRFVEENPTEAKELGLSESRLSENHPSRT